MEKANIENLLNIFNQLTTELPQELIYRENNGCIELKSLDSLGGSCTPDMSWKLVSNQTYDFA